jgi:16S rRNA (cytosine967-C5)-methyltransferase
MPRLTAWRILRSKNKVTLRAVDRAAEHAGLSDRDRSLLRRIVGTEVRRRGTLRAITRTFSRGKPSTAVQDMIAVGLVQIFFMDQIPDHAAVSETVRAAIEALGDRKSRYVNAVLRNALRARAGGISKDACRDLPLRNWHFTVPIFHDPAVHPLLWAEEALSMPVPLMKRWIKRYGSDRAFALAESALVEPDLSLRVVRGDVETVLADFAQTDGSGTDLARLVRFRPGGHPRILLASMGDAGPIVRSKLFLDGTITVQGESALRAAELVEARAGERVLDLCAAPGGKTAVLAATGAHVVACDDDEKRVVRLKQTLARVVPDAVVEVRVQDGTTGLEPESFDAVLVDVPCSNTGVLAARPGARWRFSTDSQRALAELQVRLLTGAAACVKHGGRLVYSTCSIEPEENQRRVRAFVAVNPEFTIEREIESLPDPRGARGPVDGGYAARLRRA